MRGLSQVNLNPQPKKSVSRQVAATTQSTRGACETPAKGALPHFADEIVRLREVTGLC